MRQSRADDGGDGEEVEGSVEEREGGALARAFERRAARQLLAPLDVAGRQRPQRARELGPREIGEMPRLERGEPGVNVVHLFQLRIIVIDGGSTV